MLNEIKVYSISISICAFFVSLLINSSYAQSLANFQDPILGISFQYPSEWSPVTLYQKGPLNEIAIYVKEYVTKMPDKLIEHRYKGDVLVKIENFFPLQMNLAQYFENTFSNSRFLPDFKVIELDKMATFMGSPAYKLVYTYTNKTGGDNVKILSTNVFTVKDNKAYSISFDAPINLYHFYEANLKKIIDTFTITN
jgi:PsbP-like protein